MSLDIYLESTEKSTCQCVCDKCDFVHEHSYYEELYRENITHNLGKMADACGLYGYLWRPDEHEITLAEQLIPHLEKGLDELIRHPAKYKEYNPSNGYGSYDGLVKATFEYLEACKQFPKSRVRVCR